MASSSSSSSPDVSHALETASPQQYSFKYASHEDVLEDLTSRFILNLPEEELASVERICFQVEQAHWYYEDFIREENPKFPSLPLKKFSAMLFHSCPLLKQWSHDHEQAFNTFMQYKTGVPVCGAIMLNDNWDKCVLVKGWKSSSGWGFPKGKINQDEEPFRCAIREVLEETGYDLTKQINPNDCIEMVIKDQRVALFVVPNVPEDFPFQTRTRKEISKIEWFNLGDLPTWKRNKQTPGKFYLISPFVPPLKEFIRVNKASKRRQQQQKTTQNGKLGSTTVTSSERNDQRSDSKSPSVTQVSHNVNGSSSQSSTEQVLPHTPSPTLQDTRPSLDVSNGDSKNGTSLAMDPHFARLMEGLSLSAAKLSSGGVPDNSSKGDSSLLSNINGRTVPQHGVSSHYVQQHPSDSNTPTPSTNKRNTRTVEHIVHNNGALGTSALGITHAPPKSSPPRPERVMKHLALLESVASESARMVSSGPHPSVGVVDASPPSHPGPSSSVPPMLHNFSPLQQHCLPVMPYRPSAVMQTFIPTPPIRNVDPLTTQMRSRPMTSNGVHGYSHSTPTQTPMRPARHGTNLSMHQGNLLNILGGDNRQPDFALHHQRARPINTSIGGMAPIPVIDISPRPRQIPAVTSLPTMANGLPTVAFTGPVVGPHLSMPLTSGNLINPAQHMNDRSHLLSLLNPSINPQSKAAIMPNLNMDATRRN